SYVMLYAPELLGALASYPELEGEDAKDIKKFMEQIELRRKAAENIPQELFDIDLHIFEKKEADIQMRFIMESKYGYIGASASGGSKWKMKKYRKIYRSIYQYYGVTQEDIDRKTSRYKEVIKSLAMK
ncbi:MAG: TIGR03761 family integrating conjugative element protein, partial [Lachnospiraceae bacterium]|nr:TIGR03761 family integrating conjugative element protein [Lachnospiraceae bacterium]